MSIGSESEPSRLEMLSALCDGELDPAATARACAFWREDVLLRSSWHDYQLIGDVLRSDDLAGGAAHDAAFLAGLRLRLASEPVVLAPDAVAGPATGIGQRVPARAAGGRWSWMAPTAVAAGFVMVTGALLMTRAPLPGIGSAEPTLARLTGGMSEAKVVTAPTLAASDTRMGPASLIRDPRLDRYLDAHKQFAGTSALGVPYGFLRNAAAEAPSR